MAATVTRISIAPVKGLALVHPDEVVLEHTGVAANRRFHIVDANGRRYNQIRNGRLVQIKPVYDADSGHLTLTFPDGTIADADVVLGDAVTVDFYGRPVTGHDVVGPFADALSSSAGRPLRLIQSAPGAAVDRARGHVSLISEASLRALAAGAGDTEPVDGRRFRISAIRGTKSPKRTSVPSRSRARTSVSTSSRASPVPAARPSRSGGVNRPSSRRRATSADSSPRTAGR